VDYLFAFDVVALSGLLEGLQEGDRLALARWRHLRHSRRDLTWPIRLGPRGQLRGGDKVFTREDLAFVQPRVLPDSQSEEFQRALRLFVLATAERSLGASEQRFSATLGTMIPEHLQGAEREFWDSMLELLVYSKKRPPAALEFLVDPDSHAAVASAQQIRDLLSRPGADTAFDAAANHFQGILGISDDVRRLGDFLRYSRSDELWLCYSEVAT